MDSTQNRKLKVSIGIPAFNEEGNIGFLLSSLLGQKEEGFEIIEIIIISDGSTDRTGEIVKSFKNPKIKFIEAKERLGQQARQNEMLKMFCGDILVLAEADTLPAARTTVGELIVPFIEGAPFVGMVCSNSIPIKAETVFEKVLMKGYELKKRIFEDFKGGENIYFAGGHSLRAISRDAAEQISLPLDAPEDAYLYLKIKELGWNIAKSAKAQTYMKNVSNFSDRLKQCRKFINGKRALRKYFPSDILQKEYQIPFVLKARRTASALFHDPLWTSLVLMEIFANRLATFRIRGFDPFSEPHLSSKKLSNKFKIRIYSSLDEVFLGDWKALWENTPAAPITSSPEWFKSAVWAFGEKDIYVVALYDSLTGRLSAVLPLVGARLCGKKILTIPGAEFSIHAPILGDLGRYKFSSELLAAVLPVGALVIPGFYKEEADKIAASEKSAIYFQTDEEFLMDFSQGAYGGVSTKKINLSLNRMGKDLKTAGFDIEDGTREDSLQKCFQIDKESVKHQMGKGVFWREDARRFYLELTRRVPKNFLISVLSFNGLPVSYWMFFVRGSSYMGTQKAYLSGYEYYNPGFITFVKFLDSVRDGKEKTISLGLGRDRFKTDFTKKSRALYTLIASNSFSARICLSVYLHMRELAYKAVAAYPKIYKNFKRIKNLFSSYE